MSNEEDLAAVALFVSLLDVSRQEASLLADAGYNTLEELAYVPPDELSRVDGLAADRILLVRERARKCLLGLA